MTAEGEKRAVVIMEHSARKGGVKILLECTLQLTSKCVVDRVITDLCVLDGKSDGLGLVEVALDARMDEVRTKTEVPIRCAAAA